MSENDLNLAENDLTLKEINDLFSYISQMDELAAQEPDDRDAWETWNAKIMALNEKYKDVVAKTLSASVSDWKDNPRGATDVLKYYIATNSKLNLQMFADEQADSLFSRDFLPMLNNNSINDFIATSKHDFKLDNFTKTATLTTDKGVVYAIKNYDTLAGDLATPAKKLLDTAILYLTNDNYFRGKVSRPTVEIPIIPYGEANGRNLTARHMKSTTAQTAERKRVEERLKDWKKELRGYATEIKHVEFSKEETRGRSAGNGGLASIISSFNITTHDGEPVLRMNFDVDIAQSLVNSYITSFPTILLRTDNKNPNAYAIGRKIALQKSNDHNIARNTQDTLKVKTLLAAAPEIISYEALKAKGQRNWKDKIKGKLEKAIAENVKTGYIIHWQYRDARTGEIYTPEQANDLSWDDWYNLDIDTETLEDPGRIERTQRKKAEKEAKEEAEKEAAQDA